MRRGEVRITKHVLLESLVGRQGVLRFLKKQKPEQVKKQSFDDKRNDYFFPEFAAR